MPYDLLDAIERATIRDKRSPVEVFHLVRGGFPQFTAEQLGVWIERFFRLWSRNQWKRERYAPSFHLDDENLDRRPGAAGRFCRAGSKRNWRICVIACPPGNHEGTVRGNHSTNFSHMLQPERGCNQLIRSAIFVERPFLNRIKPRWGAIFVIRCSARIIYVELDSAPDGA